jgi:beta-barrel assembly-enhancing protease
MMGSVARWIACALLLGATAGCGTLSVQEEKELGAQEQRRVRQSAQLFRDPVVVNYVRKLGEELSASSRPSPFKFRFYVIEDESLNAFAVPGGAIYVHTGLILAANDVSELAGVMSHEIGHITARHSAEQYKRLRNTSIFAQIVGFAAAVLTGQPQAAGLVTDLGARAYLNTFSQDAEREADTLGVETMVKAGYDPFGLVRFFQTLQGEGGGGGIPQFLSTHPATPERIKNTTKEIEQVGVAEGKTDDGGRFEIIQERIRLLEGTEVEFNEDEEDSGGQEESSDDEDEDSE